MNTWGLIVIVFLLIFVLIMIIALMQAKKTIHVTNEMYFRFKNYYYVTNQWLRNKNIKKSSVGYFQNRQFSSIAIYGLGELGNRLYEELRDSDISIKYFIDKNSDEICHSMDRIPVFRLDEVPVQEKVDAIIVTPVYDFDTIEESLTNAGVQTKILSLEDVIYSA